MINSREKMIKIFNTRLFNALWRMGLESVEEVRAYIKKYPYEEYKNYPYTTFGKGEQKLYYRGIGELKYQEIVTILENYKDADINDICDWVLLEAKKEFSVSSTRSCIIYFNDIHHHFNMLLDQHMINDIFKKLLVYTDIANIEITDDGYYVVLHRLSNKGGVHYYEARL